MDRDYPKDPAGLLDQSYWASARLWTSSYACNDRGFHDRIRNVYDIPRYNLLATIIGAGCLCWDRSRTGVHCDCRGGSGFSVAGALFTRSSSIDWTVIGFGWALSSGHEFDRAHVDGMSTSIVAPIYQYIELLLCFASNVEYSMRPRFHVS